VKTYTVTKTTTDKVAAILVASPIEIKIIEEIKTK
jgi:hypothetical protein